MKFRTLLIAATVICGPVWGALADCAKDFPELKTLFQALDPLQKTAGGKSNESFESLLLKAAHADNLANEMFSQIQSIGCNATGAEAAKFKKCSVLLNWSCESIPPSIDTKAILSRAHKTEIEALALETGQFFESKNIFETCCGDFGCKPDGVGSPDVFSDKTKMLQLIKLASSKSEYGITALKTLKMSEAGLSKGICRCTANEDGKELRATLIQILSTAGSDKTLQAAALAPVKAMVARLATGFPKTPCTLPGY